MALLPLHVQWASLSLGFSPPHQVPPHCHSFLSWFGEGILALSVPVSPMGFPVLKTTCIEGIGLGDRIWDDSWQVRFWNHTLKTREEKKHRKAFRADFVLLCPPISDCGHLLSSGHSWTQSPQNWGETSSLGSRSPRVGMWAVLSPFNPRREALNPLPQEGPQLRWWGWHGVG